MESIVFSDNQAPEAPQADTYFMDPPGPFGYRLHVNLMLAPGIPSEYQDAVPASLHDVAELVRRNDSLRHYTRRVMGKPFRYAVAAEANRLPVIYPSPLHYNDSEDYFYPQVYYYAVRVDVNEYGEPALDRSCAENCRDLLFAEFPRHVRLAYVGPTNDCVYLVCQGFYGGSRDLDFFVNCRHRDQDLMAEWIRQKRHDPLEYPHVQRCDFCYLSFDPGARWRPFIQDKRQKENEL
jgi:hypothetical protein